MPSIPAIVRALGAVVLVLGLLVGGLGAVQAVTDDCESGYGLHVDRLDAGEAPSRQSETVDFENLSSREQTVFRESLGSDSSPVYQDEPVVDELSGTVVTYRGDRYEAVEFVVDCLRSWVGFLFGGGALVATGVVLGGTAHAWLRYRG